jgi:hypothetical protein
LQRKGLLVEFYRRFRADQRHDPRGAKTIGHLFPGQTWNGLDGDFQRWVLTLRP